MIYSVNMTAAMAVAEKNYNSQGDDRLMFNSGLGVKIQMDDGSLFVLPRAFTEVWKMPGFKPDPHNADQLDGQFLIVYTDNHGWMVFSLGEVISYDSFSNEELTKDFDWGAEPPTKGEVMIEQIFGDME